MYISNTIILPEWKVEITRYITHHANEDGGWGLHLESESTVFATALYYVVLRILGMGPSHPVAFRARETLLTLGKSTQLKDPGGIDLEC